MEVPNIVPAVMHCRKIYWPAAFCIERHLHLALNANGPWVDVEFTGDGPVRRLQAVLSTLLSTVETYCQLSVKKYMSTL